MKNVKVSAFTLLETLVALLVISGGLLLFQSMTKLLVSEIHYQQNQEVQDWLLFADQLEIELSRSTFDKVENNKIYVQQDGKAISFGQSKAEDFRKTSADGRGYQPMVYGLKETIIKRTGNFILIQLRFKKGLEREFMYRVEEKS